MTAFDQCATRAIINFFGPLNRDYPCGGGLLDFASRFGVRLTLKLFIGEAEPGGGYLLNLTPFLPFGIFRHVQTFNREFQTFGR